MGIFSGAKPCVCGAPLRAIRTDVDGSMITVKAFCNICGAESAPAIGVGADSENITERAITFWDKQRKSAEVEQAADK